MTCDGVTFVWGAPGVCLPCVWGMDAGGVFFVSWGGCLCVGVVCGYEDFGWFVYGVGVGVWLWWQGGVCCGACGEAVA